MRIRSASRCWRRRGNNGGGCLPALRPPLDEPEDFVLVLMADLPMKIRHETPAPLPGKGVNQMQTDRAAVDSELALLAVGGYERKSWQVNPYFNKREDFVGSGLPSFLVCRLDGLTPDTCMRLVAEPANVEKKGLWGGPLWTGAAPMPRGPVAGRRVRAREGGGHSRLSG